MKTNPIDLSLAITSGITLAGMIAINGHLAAYSSPVLASWLAHGVGGVASLFMLIVLKLTVFSKTLHKTSNSTPLWVYAGGIPGAFTVILASYTVNSPLGLSGSLILIISGQILFGVLSDFLGLWGLEKRMISGKDTYGLCLIGLGAIILLFKGG